MKKAKSAVTKVARLEEKLEDFEKRVTKNGNTSANLSKKISNVENKLKSTDTSLNDSSSKLAQDNKVKMETLETQLESVKLELAQLKLDRSASKTESNSDKSWFDNKFHAFLEAPKARKIVHDWIDTKLHTHKVNSL